MSAHPTVTPLDIRTRLADALGYDDYPKNASADPYLSYITMRHVGGGPLDDWLELFIHVMEHFKPQPGTASGPFVAPAIQTLIDEIVLGGFRQLFADTSAGNPARKTHVEDKVMYILGTWATMQSSFIQHKNQARRITSAYGIFAEPTNPPRKPYEENLADLISKSGLLPGGAWDHRVRSEQDSVTRLVSLLSSLPVAAGRNSTLGVATQALGKLQIPATMPGSIYSVSQPLDDLDADESVSIVATRLNAFTLSVLSAVDVSWTYNVSRHMSLARSNGRYTLELFALPCAFPATTKTPVGIPDELAHEIQESYAILFNAWFKNPWHARLGSVSGIRRWCWCWSCSARRYSGRCAIAAKTFSGSSVRRRPFRKVVAPPQSAFDPTLVGLMGKDPEFAWTPDCFPHLWPRIVGLEQHLQTSRPWSLWVLFHYRRDTFQFWTFLFATVVVFLTIVQVALGCAQVVGSFK